MWIYIKNITAILFVLLSVPFGCLGGDLPISYTYKYNKEAGKADQTPLLLDLLDKIDKTNPAKIVFEKGIYHFYPDKAFGTYHEITNHDNGYYRMAFPLCGFNGIEIDGQGSEFIFHGQIIPFLVLNSADVTIRNVVIDWELPHFVQGTIIAADTLMSTIDIRIPDEYKVRQDANRLVFGSEGWEHTFLGENIVFDPQKKAPMYFTDKYHINYSEQKNILSEKLSENIYRLTAPFKKSLPPLNSIITFKGITRFNRTSPAIHLKSSKDVELVNVTIHHAGGMGVIAEKTENISLDRVNVMLREGSGRMVTTTADATHFCNCRGKLTIQNCTFENMLDDAANVHGIYLRVEKAVDKNILYASISHFHQYGYNFVEVGDTIRFVNDSTLLPMSVNVVSKLEKVNHRYYRISFEKDLPEGLKYNDGIENISWYPQTVIRNNIVRNNRARGFLVSSGKPVLIEGNKITSQMSAILFEGDLNFWFESGAVNNVTIRNNEFIDCAYSGNKQPVIFINPMMKKHMSEKYEKNIFIENNLFRTFDTYILSAKSVDGLYIKNNTIEQTKTYPPIWGNMPMFNIMECINVEITGNKSVKSDITIEVDKNSIHSSKISDNQ